MMPTKKNMTRQNWVLRHLKWSYVKILTNFFLEIVRIFLEKWHFRINPDNSFLKKSWQFLLYRKTMLNDGNVGIKVYLNNNSTIIQYVIQNNFKNISSYTNKEFTKALSTNIDRHVMKFQLKMLTYDEYPI